MLKIILCYEYCNIGGLQTWMLDLCRRLQGLGHECELFFFTSGPFLELIPPEQTVHLGDLSDLLRIVRTRNIDVVHGAMTDWSYGISAVRRLGAKLILTGHGRIHPCWNSTNCDALAGCSKWDAAAQQEWTDLPVQVIINGVDTRRFHPPGRVDSGRPIVAWVGRGSDLHQKRIDRLAGIAPQLSREGFRLWIADPDGPDRVIPSVASALKPIAEFWGMVAPEQMPEFYRNVAASGGCLLSTSRFEGLSIAQLEAQASGCVVVGPDLPGTNEAVRPEHGGILYEDSSGFEQIACIIRNALSDREQMHRRQEACRSFVESQFNCESMAANYLKLYDEAPYARQKGWRSLITTHRFSPLFGFHGYQEYRWTAGHNQYLASLKLRSAGDRELACRAAIESLHTSPTLYTRWKRAFHLGTLIHPIG